MLADVFVPLRINLWTFEINDVMALSRWDECLTLVLTPWN